MKNNRIEAVLVSKSDYGRMSEALEILEQQEIVSIIEKRISKPYKTISLKEMAKLHNVKLD